MGTPLSDQPLRILLAAEEAAGLQALKAVDQSEHELVGVLTSNTHGDSRGATVDGVARNLGYPVWSARDVKDPALAERMRSLQVDVLLNVHSLYLIHADVVTAPRIGSFNLHPGPLPDYAGLNTPMWAVFNGETRYGVTLHWMSPDVDTGDIAYQEMFDLDGNDTGRTVSTKCVRLGVPLVNRLLTDAGTGSIPQVQQDLSKRRYFLKKDKPDVRIDWSKSARAIDAHVRAADYYPLPSPWGHPVAQCNGEDVRIAKVKRTDEATTAPPGTVETHGETRVVATGDEWLAIVRVQTATGYQPAAAVMPNGTTLT